MEQREILMTKEKSELVDIIINIESEIESDSRVRTLQRKILEQREAYITTGVSMAKKHSDTVTSLNLKIEELSKSYNTMQRTISRLKREINSLTETADMSK